MVIDEIKCAKCEREIFSNEEGTSTGRAYHCPIITGKPITDKKGYIYLCSLCYPEFNNNYYDFLDWLMFDFLRTKKDNNLDSFYSDFCLRKEKTSLEKKINKIE